MRNAKHQLAAQLFLTFLVFFGSNTLRANPIDIIESELVTVIEKTMPGAVVVESRDAASDQSLNIGSGVIIHQNGYILTSSQVTAGAKSAKIQFPDGSNRDAQVVGSDHLTGTSLLKVDGQLKPPVLGNSDALHVGSWVLSIGNSYGMSFSPATGFITHLKREMGERQLIQVSIPIRPGDSGAPVFNKAGQLIGIIVAALGNSNQPGASSLVGDGCDNNIGFITPINDLKMVLDDLINDGHVNRGWLGVQIRNLTDRELKDSGLEMRQALVITRVLKDSPAENSGLKPGDILSAVDGKDTNSLVDIRTYILNQPPYKTVTISVIREKQPLIFDVTLGEMPRLTP